MKNRRPWLSKTLLILPALFFALVVSTAPVFAAAGVYPSKPVRLIVPFPPGGGTDIVARQIAPYLSERLGQQIILENRGGGGSVIGTEMVAKAAPDGYTLLIVDAASTTQPALQKLPYDPIKSFAPVAMIATLPSVLCINSSVPANSLKELIALAKERPGQLIFTSSGVGSNTHLATELFKSMADINIKIVQFKGSGPAIIDVLGGHSSGLITSVAVAMPYITSGKLRVLGTSPKRFKDLPNVPTIAEAGLPGYELNSFRGILAPAGTPVSIIDKLTKELNNVLALDEVKKAFLKEGVNVEYLGPTEFGTFLDRDIAKWVRIVKEANIKVEGAI
jgi:tripartite-type tricarboxylate transporter receptor subunit TctC